MTKEDALQSEAFKQWVQDETKKKWVFDSKRAVVALRWHDVDLKGVDNDVLLASYVVNPQKSYEDVANVAKEALNIALSDEKVYGKGAKQAIPPKKS